MKHLPMGWLLPTAVLLLPAMPGNTAHTSEKGENMKHEKNSESDFGKHCTSVQNHR